MKHEIEKYGFFFGNYCDIVSVRSSDQNVIVDK